MVWTCNVRGVMLTKAVRKRPTMHSDRAATIWFTGLPGAGKTTLARRLELEIQAHGHYVEVLDGDRMRQDLSVDLGYSKQDRDRNVMRIGFIADLLSRNGIFVIVSAIAPYRETRLAVRSKHEAGRFIEVHVNCPVSILMARDRKGNYRRATTGDIPLFTGVSDPYESPLEPEIVVHTDLETEAESHDHIVNWLCKSGYLNRRIQPRESWTPIHTHALTALFEEETRRYV